MLSKLFICTIGFFDTLRGEISSQLNAERYHIQHFNYSQEFLTFFEQKKEEIDCLIIAEEAQTYEYFVPLVKDGILLPAIVALDNRISANQGLAKSVEYFHEATQRIESQNLEALETIIDQAIAQFLHLSPSCILSDRPPEVTHDRCASDHRDTQRQAFLLLQQRRLAEKLKERLGYLGVYYNRNSKYFYRNLSPAEQDEFRLDFMADYREIVLDYFNGDPPINQAIDQFVNQAFFADVSISYILETHMKLMDDFSQQLKLEGRSEDILLDYRLTLIDIVAHLCEMYRRSIPREDLPLELLLRID